MAQTQIHVPPGFDDLPKIDQVRYLQELWDRIANCPGEVPAPDSHLDLAEARLRRHRDDPSASTAAIEVLDRLSRRSE